MILLIQNNLPYLVLVAQIGLVILFVATITRARFLNSLGRHTLWAGFLISLVAVCGSLFYSEIVGFEPCVLCWWQRVFLYPQVILFAIALWRRDRGIFKYSVALALCAGVVALYHSYVYMGGTSLLPCTALGGACSKVYVYAFHGLVTIPSMSLTIVLYLLLLTWINKIYENRHA